MTSNSHASASPSNEASSASPDDHRTTSSTFSASRARNSYASSETAESSTAASLRDHSTHGSSHDGTADGGLILDVPHRDGKGSFRSHRSRSSGGFLLSNSTFEPPSRDVTPPKSSTNHRSSDHKGKAVLRSPEKRHSKRRSNLGLGLSGSPLAGNVTNAALQEPENGDVKGANGVDKDAGQSTKAAGILDVDSTQIVNLALNLSESRRNASRRLVSSPLPPMTSFAENMAGGSMRYHMQQQQRRSSRNVSPKPDRGDRNLSMSGRIPSGARINSPLQPAFDLQSEGQYQYHFSSSTLARAEKAKAALELMAQYRELLSYIPPLKPQILERTTTAATFGSSINSPISPYPYTRTNTRSDQPRPLGRQYNPLQYIRNRKVRARLSETIDGDAQGFGDPEQVTDWVQQISKESTAPGYRSADCLLLPPFNPLEIREGRQISPAPALGSGGTSTKIKRPRIDWLTSPADMLADIYWLEQEDNKKLIEDRFGRQIFPQQVELRRPVSRQEVVQEPQASSHQAGRSSEDQERRSLEAKLPQFKSVKPESENFAEKSASKAKEKLRHVRDAARMHHHNSSGRDVRQFLRSRSRSSDSSSSSSSSESDSNHRARRKRSGTADSTEIKSQDILAKQMAELLEKETKVTDQRAGVDHQGRRDAIAVGERKSSGNDKAKKSDSASASHSRSTSSVGHSKRNSLVSPSPGRASLEVPGTNARGSLDLELDTTAPNSPELRAGRANNAHIPSISMDLASSRIRYSSPGRALSKVRARMHSTNDRSYNSDHSLLDEDATISDSNAKKPQPQTPEQRRRSISPIKKIVARRTGEAGKPATIVDIRKDRAEDPSGIRGFLKSARNPVNRVSGMLWKRDSPPGHGFSSSVSTDDSEVDSSHEEVTGEISGIGKFEDLAEAHPPKEKPSYLKDMPSFLPSTETRGRSTQARDSQRGSASLLDIQEDRVRRTTSPKAYPLINIESPVSSPEFVIPNWDRRASSVSASRKGSFPDGVQQADSRLNAILGYPGKRRNDGLPITGLSGLDTTHRRPSMQGKRQWSISNQGVSVAHGPTTKREVARIRALLLSSGVKAKEISRRSAALTDLRQEKALYSEIAQLAQKSLLPVPKSQEHILAAQILSDDIQLSARLWQESADTFCNTAVTEMISSIENLQSRVTASLTPLTRKTADEADEVSKDLVTSQTLNVKHISDKIDKMMRTRRRRFRWLRRGGWVLVEWTLVGVMWYVWFLVVVCRVVFAVGKGIVGSVRWLLFL